MPGGHPSIVSPGHRDTAARVGCGHPSPSCALSGFQVTLPPLRRGALGGHRFASAVGSVGRIGCLSQTSAARDTLPLSSWSSPIYGRGVGGALPLGARSARTGLERCWRWVETRLPGSLVRWSFPGPRSPVLARRGPIPSARCRLYRETPSGCAPARREPRVQRLGERRSRIEDLKPSRPRKRHGLGLST